jgi:predicted RNase H-like HicB family nuclease
MQRFYVAIIEKAKDGYGVFFPDLPGCTSFGATIAKAAENAYVAAQAHAALTQEFGEAVPKPRAPENIPRDAGVKEKARLLVPVEIGEEPVRVNISLPASALAALDRTAKELSLTRSGAIAHLALVRDSTTGQFASRSPKRAENVPRKSSIVIAKRQRN